MKAEADEKNNWRRSKPTLTIILSKSNKGFRRIWNFLSKTAGTLFAKTYDIDREVARDKQSGNSGGNDDKLNKKLGIEKGHHEVAIKTAGSRHIRPDVRNGHNGKKDGDKGGKSERFGDKRSFYFADDIYHIYAEQYSFFHR